MSHALETGIKNAEVRTVALRDTAQEMGSGTLAVYATPAMVALMEYTAYRAVVPYLAAGTGTVGTYMETKHLAATPVGATVRCMAELIEIDRKRLRFQIEVSDDAGVIGTAIHDRFIVEDATFMEKCVHRLD